MKKLALTFAIVLGMSIGAFAQGGLFQYGNTNQAFSSPTWFGTTSNWQDNWNRTSNPLLPAHGQNENQTAPLGSGALLLIGFGAAYALKKKNQK